MLEARPELRNSDDKLLWAVWVELGYATPDSIAQSAFFNPQLPAPESITRCRRKLQEQYPHLQATEAVRRGRNVKAQEKGTHIYREIVFEGNQAKLI